MAPTETGDARQVLLPTEHGGWSLTMEPVLLGLVVAPSSAGLVLGLAALVAFVARTPLKLALVDRWRRRRLPRTVLAERAAGAELVLLALLAVAAVALAEWPFWWPLALAAPLVAVELWYDMRSRGRHLAPELLGAVGMGSVAAAVALAGGAADGLAAALWTVLAARSLAAIPFVRVQLRRAKSQEHRTWWSDGAQVVAVLVVVVGLAVWPVPVAGAAAVVALGAVHAVLVRRPVPRVAIVGAQQVALGLAVVAATGLGAR
jgi:hypothetical protein